MNKEKTYDPYLAGLKDGREFQKSSDLAMKRELVEELKRLHDQTRCYMYHECPTRTLIERAEATL